MEEDRISNLSDEILQHILSFIDTTQAVQTSILSKRWTHLWRSLLNIRLYLRGAASRDRLCRFVSQFLSHRDAAAPLHDFHLSLDTEIWLREDEAHVEECALYAINHGAQSFCILAPTTLLNALPTALFTSAMLRELVIRQRRKSLTRTYKPKRLSLPNLKTLYLDVPNLYFTSDQGKDLFSGLPELEKLCLIRFQLTGLVLKAPKLRVLEILESYDIFQEIYAPLLTSFRYKGYLPLECSIMNVPMLEQVYLNIYGPTYNLEHVRLLHQLGNATIVSLTFDTLKALELDGGPIDQSPPFPNIKCLKVIKGSFKLKYTECKRVMDYLTIGTLNFDSLIVEFPEEFTTKESYSYVENMLFGIIVIITIMFLYHCITVTIHKIYHH